MSDPHLEVRIVQTSKEIIRQKGARTIRRTYQMIGFRGFLLFLLPILLNAVAARLSSQWLGLLALAFLTALVSGIGIYSTFGLIHDRIHNTTTHPGDIPEGVTAFTAVILGISSYTYNRAHLAHHSFLGNRNKDPQYIFLEEKNSAAFAHVEFPFEELQIKHHPLIRVVIALAKEIGGIVAKRDQYLLKSLFSKKSRKILYRQLSFIGVQRSEISDDYVALNASEVKKQRVLDLLRIIYQCALILMLFSHYTRYVAISAMLATSVAAMLNLYRISLEHSYEENTGDRVSFNRRHSSNTAGGNLVHKIVWYPVPWHALHHAVPAMPFFLLGELHKRLVEGHR